MYVEALDNNRADLDQWQDFVDSTPDAGALHHIGWLSVLRDVYAVKPFYLMAKTNEGAVAGIMPCYRAASPFTGAHYTTLEGGILGHPMAQTALFEEAMKRLCTDRVQYFQIRGGVPSACASHTLETVHTIVSTSDGPDAVWVAMKPKTRWAVRQMEKLPLEVVQDDRFELLDTFHSLYAERMRQLGTPTFGREVFQAMRAHLGEVMRLYMVLYEGRPVGGMLCMIHGQRVTDLYAIVSRERAPELANYLLYADVLRRTAGQGFASIDLGRSTPGSGVHLFKRKWGGHDVAVPYYFYARDGAQKGTFGLLKDTREKGLAQRIWSRLPPAACNTVGPILRRQLPFL